MTLKQLTKEYEKICEKIEQLNEEAFALEKEIATELYKNESQPKQNK